MNKSRTLDQFYKEVYSEATQHILPFWNNMVDIEYGGFYGEMNHALELNREGVKGGIATARLLWSYARAYKFTGDKIHRQLMEHAYNFLVDKVLDREEGGIFWAVDYKGQVTDDRKHVYAQSFAIYALSEYVLATENEQALSYAIQLFELIEEKGYSRENQGYLEEFDCSWQLKDNEMLSENNVIAYFTMNTHLHILEAYTNLYRVYPNVYLRERLLQLLETFKHNIYDSDNGIMKVFLDEKWQSILDLNSYGHDIEATWLLQEALDVLGIEDVMITEMNEIVGQNILLRSIMSDGSIANETEKGQVDARRVWWGQAEAMVGFLNLYQHTSQDKYLEAALSCWEFIKEHIIDQRDSGEWHYGLEADLSVSKENVVEPWKTPYHNLRSCIEVLERVSLLKMTIL